MLQLRCATVPRRSRMRSRNCPCSAREVSIASTEMSASAHDPSEGEAMTASHGLRRYLAMGIAFAGLLGVASAAELNPAAVTYKLPEQIPWGPVNAAGAQQAVVLGDPTKPGF